MDIVALEQAVVRSWAAQEPEFDGALEALLGGLLSWLGGGGLTARPTEGLLLKHRSWKALGFSGVGVAVLVNGQQVQPVRIRLSLGGNRETLESGAVQFGARRAQPVIYGTKEHEKLTTAILADPGVEFRWLLRFTRDAAGWSRDAT